MKLDRRYKQPLVYVAGKYGNGDRLSREEIDNNIHIARIAAIEIWEMGFAVICPHLNSYHFGDDCELTHEQYLEGDFRILDGCDIIYMLPNWKESEGAKLEHAYADENDIIIVYEIEELEEFIGPKNVAKRYRCGICGRLRTYGHNVNKKHICSNCYTPISDIMADIIKTDQKKFLKIPRL